MLRGIPPMNQQLFQTLKCRLQQRSETMSQTHACNIVHKQQLQKTTFARELENVFLGRVCGHEHTHTSATSLRCKCSMSKNIWSIATRSGRGTNVRDQTADGRRCLWFSAFAGKHPAAGHDAQTDYYTGRQIGRSEKNTFCRSPRRTMLQRLPKFIV
jgi:hypothetical protein